MDKQSPLGKLQERASRISSSFYRASQVDRTLSQDEERDCREFYLSVMNDPHYDYQQKKELLLAELGRQIADSFNYTKLAEPAQITCYNSQWDQIRTIETTGLLLLGSITQNELVWDTPMASRLHSIVYVYVDKIVVIDLASLNGTVAVNATKGSTVHSKRKDRKIIAFDRTDTVGIEISSLHGYRSNITGPSIVFNPKPCIICMDRPRQIKLNCGHAVCCNNCYQKIMRTPSSIGGQVCPTCRVPIQNPDVRFGHYNCTFSRDSSETRSIGSDVDRPFQLAAPHEGNLFPPVTDPAEQSASPISSYKSDPEVSDGYNQNQPYDSET